MNENIKWEDLESELKRALMFHWFTFYSVVPISEIEVTKIEYIVNHDVDRLFDLINSFAITTGDISSTPLIACMHANREMELLDSTLDRSLFKGSKRKMYEDNRQIILRDLVQTYVIVGQLMNGLDNGDDDDFDRRRTK